MKEEWAARVNCIGSQNVGFAKKNAAPQETNKVPKHSPDHHKGNQDKET